MPIIRLRTLLVWTLVTACVAVAAWLVRGRLRNWTQHHSSERLVTRITSVPEDQVAALVRRLVELDADAPALLVPLLADKRQSVARSAREGIDQLLTDWRHARGDEAAPRIARLAHELATVAPRLPVEHTDWAQSLAARLLVWPVHDLALSGRVISDCEIVLRLPKAERGELHVASAERTIEADELAVLDPPPVIQELPGTLPAARAPELEVVIPRVYGPVEPARLPDASQERPVRPKQFLPPRAMKIDG